MKAQQQRIYLHILPLIALLVSMLSITLVSLPTGQLAGLSASLTSAIAPPHPLPVQHKPRPNAPTPFMYRPYYGNKSVQQRTISYVDHDKPWYESDGTFVRFDGQKWTNVSIGSCTPRLNCYDGHDGYDLDLWFEPVLSVASGTVIRANWYNPLRHNDALGLWVAIDHGNGFATAYGHLSALTVTVGDKVDRQWQVGTSGSTGSVTGPHLHMTTYYLPYWQATDPFGWTGNYPDPNTVPDNYLWVDNPGTSYTVPNLSANGSAVYPGAVVVDDGSSGWSTTGKWTAQSSKSAINGNLHWTATSNGDSSATATWQPTLFLDGYYEVGAFIDDTYASSSWAPFTIYSADPNKAGNEISHTVYVDQSHIGTFAGPYGVINTGPQWVSLGTYYFKAAMKGRVVLDNATGESNAQLGADGVEFAPIRASLSSAAYGFAVTNDTTPSSMQVGGTANVNLTLKNTSNFSWSASNVYVINRWLNAQGQVVATGQPANLPQDVTQGASVNVPVTIQAPGQGGSYTLQWDMAQDTIIFSQRGAQVHNDHVNLTATTIGPSLSKVYYFAEGYTGSSTSEALSLLNPNATSMDVTITYFFQNGLPHMRTYQIAAQSHLVLNINQEVGANKSVGMMVQGSQPLAAERTMVTHDGSFVATTANVGSPTLNTNWYFAEGNTTYGWHTLLAVLNPALNAVSLKVTYLKPAAHLPSNTYVIPPRSRATIVVNRDFPNQQFGMAINSTGAVLVERAEYLIVSPKRGGSAVVGASAPRTSWYFGTGNTTAGFTERLVLANPSFRAASAQVRYLLTDGRVLTQNVAVPGMSRIEVNVNSILGQVMHATIVNSSAPIVAERQDFFAVGSSVVGSTASMGSGAPYAHWYVAQGDTLIGHNEVLALANPNTAATQVRITYYSPSRAPATKVYTLPANTRLTVNVAGDVGIGRSVAVAINADLPIVVEQIMFFNQQGITGGYECIGTGA